MSSEERIELKDALEDSPQVQAQVGKLEGEISSLKDYTTLLRDTFQACHLHQQKVCEGTDTLAMLLNSYQPEVYGDKDGLLSSAFRRIGRYLHELHSCQDMLSTQLQNAVVELLSLLLSKDFAHLEKLKENLEASAQEHEQAMAKFSRVSKKKDSDKASFEANADLYTARRKHFETSLDYYSEINGFQLKRKFSLMEPLLTFMHAQMAYFKVGYEILSKDLGKLLNELNSDVQKVHGRYQHEVEVMSEVRAEIELEFPNLCLPDPDPTDPFSDYHIPDTSVTSRNGYLFIRSQKTGFPSKWDRFYFYTKKTHLYMHAPQKSPEMLLNLKGAEASSVDIDDRRYVFQVNHAMLKRPVYLLAENSLIRDEWIAAINFIGQNKTAAQTSKLESISKERERIRSWVNKEIHKPAAPSKVGSPSNSLTSSATAANTLSPAPPGSGGGGGTTQGEPKKSPVLVRKLAKQRGTSEPALVYPSQRTQHPGQPGQSGQSGQLQAPLQPERVGHTAPPANATNTNGSLASYSSSFTVKYLGHTEVQEGKTVGVISETIRKVTTARSLKNVKTAQVVTMTATHRAITLLDPSSKKSIGQILLKDILRCAVHPDNSRLFGIVNRTTITEQEKEKHKLICHVMEAQNGMAVCSAVNSAIQTAYMNLQSSKQHSRSKSAQPATKSVAEVVASPSHAVRGPSPNPSQSGSLGDYNSTGYLKTDDVEESSSSGSRAHKSASETNLSSLAGGPHPPAPRGPSVSASSSASSSTDQLSMLSPTELGGQGPVEHRSSSLTSAGSDDTLSENGSFSLPLPPLPPSLSPSSDYLPNTDVPSLPTSATMARPPSMLPTLFESKPIPPSASTPASSTGGYISTDQFDPLMVDSPDDTDSPDAHKLSAQEAAANSGYFPMPSMLDTGTTSAAPPAIATTSTAQYSTTTQQKQNGLQSTVAASTGGIKSEKAGGDASGGTTSDYVAAPSDLSSSSHSSTSATATATTSTSSSSLSKSTLASTSAAVAKKSRQLFAKVLPKKSSTTSSPSKGSKTKGDTATSQQHKKQPQPAPPTSVSAPPPPIADPSTGELEDNDDSDMGDLVDLLDLGDPTDSTGASYGTSITNGSQSLTPVVPSSSLDAGQSSGYYQDTSISGFASTMAVPSTLTSDPFVGDGSVPPIPTSTLTSDPFVTGGATPTPPGLSTATTGPISATNSGYLPSPDGMGLTDQGGGSAAPNTTAPPPPAVFDPFSHAQDDDDDDSFFLPDLPGDSEMPNTSSNSGGVGVGGGGGMYAGSIVTLTSGQFPPSKK